MDLYKRHIKKDASQRAIIWTGRFSTMAFVIIGGFIAMHLKKFPTGIFTFIQEFQGFISPGVLAAFVFGFVVKRAPNICGSVALIGSAVVYALLLIFFSGYGPFDNIGVTLGEIAFLNRIAITFVVVLIVLVILRLVNPLPEAKVLPVREEFDMRPSGAIIWLGAAVIIITLVLYGIFW